MATIYSDQMTKVVATPPGMVSSGEFGGRLRHAVFTLTIPVGPNIGDVAQLCEIPAGARIMGGKFVWGTAQGATATMALGITGTTGKYRAAAITNVLTEEIVAMTIALSYGTVLAAREVILATNAAAAWTVATVLRGHFAYLVD